MFGLFKNFKNEMNKGKTVACTKSYLTKSAVMLEAEPEIHAIIDTYSNNLVDMADKMFDANRKIAISPYTMSLTCLWKAIETEYEFHKIESLSSVVFNALLMIGEHIENDTKLQSNFSEIDRVIYLDITRRIEENREKLMTQI